MEVEVVVEGRGTEAGPSCVSGERDRGSEEAEVEAERAWTMRREE